MYNLYKNIIGIKYIKPHLHEYHEDLELFRGHKDTSPGKQL